MRHYYVSKNCLFSSIKLVAMLMALAFTVGTATAGGQSLPQRSSAAPQTTSGVPHVQIGVDSVPEVNSELLRRVSALPMVDIRPTVVSLPGALGFWLLDDLQLVRPEVIVRGREFAHVHPDGSLHASLPPMRAQEAVDTGWAVWHPWAKERKGLGGFVMVYTPQSMSELEVVFQLVLDSYNYVTGKSVSAQEFK